MVLNFTFVCLDFPTFFLFSFFNNVFGLDLTEAYLYNKHESKRQKKLAIVCHACHKSSASPGMFGVRGGCPLAAKATGPLQSLEGWRICAWSFCRSQLAAWSAAPVWSERGCLASSLGQQRREESRSRPHGGLPPEGNHAHLSQDAGGVGILLSPLFVAASLACVGFESRQRTFPVITFYGFSPWIIALPSPGQTGTPAGSVRSPMCHSQQRAKPLTPGLLCQIQLPFPIMFFGDLEGLIPGVGRKCQCQVIGRGYLEGYVEEPQAGSRFSRRCW